MGFWKRDSPGFVCDETIFAAPAVTNSKYNRKRSRFMSVYGGQRSTIDANTIGRIS